MPVSAGRTRVLAMPRKIPIDLLMVALACAIAGSGYAFGEYLAQRDRAGEAPAAIG